LRGKERFTRGPLSLEERPAEHDLRLKAKGKTGKLCTVGSYEKNSRFKGSLSMVIPPNRGYEKVFEILISLSYGSFSNDRALDREFFCLIQ